MKGKVLSLKDYSCTTILIFQCPNSAEKKDLNAYLQEIALFCHQLNITSRVKSDITSVSEQAIVVTGVRLFTPGESLGTEALSAGSQKVAIHVFNTAFGHELF